MAVIIGVFLYSIGYSQIRRELFNTNNPQNQANVNRTPFDTISPLPKDSLPEYNPDYYTYSYRYKGKKFPLLDSIFSIKDFYRLNNYTHSDTFGKVHFPNIGQVFNPLLAEFSFESPFRMVPFGKSFFLNFVEHPRFYDVKTPTTRFLYNNGMREGHSLSTLFTHNIHSRWNYAIEYNGLRSLGKYIENLSAHNAFSVSTHYITKNKRYQLEAYYVAANIDNQENAGIQNITDFTSGNSRFRARDRLLVNLTGAKSYLDFRKYQVSQSFGWFKSYDKDSLSYYPLRGFNDFSYISSGYAYKEDQVNTFFSSPVISGRDRFDAKSLKTFQNIMGITFTNSLMNLKAGILWESHRLLMNQAYNSVNFGFIPKNIAENRLGVSGELEVHIAEKFRLNSELTYSNGENWGNYFLSKNQLETLIAQKIGVRSFVHFRSSVPQLYLWVNQSFYEDFNYYLPNFSNENLLTLGGEISYKPWNTLIKLSTNRIENYTYLGSQGFSVQATSPISTILLDAETTLSWRNKFFLNLRAAYQWIDDPLKVLPLPDFVTRIALYYQAPAFRAAADIQTGLKFSYFNSFQSRVFMPVINDFALQNPLNPSMIGDFPVIDLFFNLRVKRMKIFVEAQHFHSSFTGFNFFSDPRTPYMDFRLNFGVEWLIFN